MQGKRHVGFSDEAAAAEEKDFLTDTPITTWNPTGARARVTKVRNDMKHGLREGWVPPPNGTGYAEDA